MAKHFWRFLPQGTVLAIATVAIIILPAHAELNISPETITIIGNRTDQVSTTLTFSDGAGIPTLKTATSDLRRADGGALIPANKIVIDPPEITVPTNEPAQITLVINLADASANGEFSGALYLYHENGRQVLPLIVRIKAAPIWPWVVMIVGVLLGTGLSFYRAEGRSRDEIIIQVGRLRTQMRGDSDLDKDFQVSIESELVDVESAVEDKAWEAAKGETLEAKTLWNRWRKGREDWIAQLQSGKRLIAEHFESLAEPVKSTIYMQGIKDRIDAVYRKLRTGQYETPQMLKDDFSEVRRLLSQYKEGELLVQQVKQIRKEAPFSANREQYWLRQLNFLETELKSLSLDEESYQAWKSTVRETRTALEAEIAQLASTESTRSLSGGGIAGRSVGDGAIASTQLSPEPSISSAFQPKQVAQATQQLRWFNWVSRVVAIALLAWLGMTELYGSNATFGADPLRDYFAVIAWGFGAELTRESVLRATQDLGLPLTK